LARELAEEALDGTVQAGLTVPRQGDRKGGINPQVAGAGLQACGMGISLSMA